MPRAEVGTTKYLNNKLKSKGLQRLRWYCQACEKQCRDENGFKMHTQSESHVRAMLLIGESPQKAINDYSAQFQRDFLQLLRTAHGEKSVHMNHFYQEYIANKEHIHMNATRWPSLTEFAKFLGREGICRVEEQEKGLFVAWIDNSPEALRRQDAIRKKERQDRGDEERERAAIRQQVERAEREMLNKPEDDGEEEARMLKREEGGEKIKLNFAAKKSKEPKVQDRPPPSADSAVKADGDEASPPDKPNPNDNDDNNNDDHTATPPAAVTTTTASPTTPLPPPPPLQLSNPPLLLLKPKNVFASSRKKPPLNNPQTKTDPPKRPMSSAERIMREELESKSKRARDSRTNGSTAMAKRQRMA